MKIAVIGTGIAGNFAAWRLAQEHDITVFEAKSRIGGHTNTIEIFDVSEDARLVHRKTVDDPLLITPNDVVSIRFSVMSSATSRDQTGPKSEPLRSWGSMMPTSPWTKRASWRTRDQRV